jgi:hypothetical protein
MNYDFLTTDDDITGPLPEDDLDEIDLYSDPYVIMEDGIDDDGEYFDDEDYLD